MLLTRFFNIIQACVLLATGSLAFHQTSHAATRDYAVEVTASIQKAPAAIQLNWRAISHGNAFSVARKEQNATSWTTLANLPNGTLTFTDRDVQVGRAYEYRVALNPIPSSGGTGYIFAGIEAPLVDDRGKLILLLDNTHIDALSSELTRMEQDLVGDGWQVTRLEVGRAEKPAAVRAKIQKIYQADPANTKAIFIFGHVPVPYSGDYTADGHPDHRGAWPADAYYGDMDGNWTDNNVNSTSAGRQENRNVPGDGKFDHNSIPSETELQVGRVDLANMGSWDLQPEVELLRGYLNKHHKFRHGLNPLPRRGFISDNFGEMGGEAFAASGWRNFAPFFGSDNIRGELGYTFFETLKNEGYLWSYACGGGAYNFCNYVGGTGDFRSNDYKSAFTMVLGSYFGDWDANTSFLRGALASPTYGLAAVWAGRPHWFLHHMALGETIGQSTRINQNNGRTGSYHPQQYAGNVHIALMGDPTLRMHPVIPPASPRALQTKANVQVAWTLSTDENLVGYHVYRAAAASGPYVRLTTAPVTGSSFVDASNSGESFYQVRAIKLESSASGTYFNQSQGVFATRTAASVDAELVPLSVRPGANKSVSINFPSEIGKSYQLLASQDFINWEKVGEVTALTGETALSAPRNSEFTFFKVVVAPPLNGLLHTGGNEQAQ
ncbi:MAG: fibronectin type III domain-containing protein [Verrucomicrobiales bacterium]